MKTLNFRGSLSTNTTQPSPEIEAFLPDENPLGIGVIIFPGGGYWNLAEHEGKGYAEYLVEQGIAGFVVKYRTGKHGHRHPCMIEDALAALETIHDRAGEFSLHRDRIGLMGSSAGGHLTAHSMSTWHEHLADAYRPAFAVLCYPAICTTGPYAHLGSLHNLLGEDCSEELKKSFAGDQFVNDKTPPCFVWHTLEDVGVPPENSFALATALRNQQIGFELHIYEKGRHGLGLKAEFNWGEDCVRWIREQFNER